MRAARLPLPVIAAFTVASGVLAPPGAGAQAVSAGAGPPAMRAAGMALRDGALAPGMLTVRVVRGSFDRNAANETVQIDVGGRVERATTGPDGRAQFAHLPIGATVQATAVVDGEALLSERFEMAAESGIRVLLIAGEGDATASGVPDSAPAAAVDPAPAAVDTDRERTDVSSRDDGVVMGIRVAFAMASAFALGLVVFGKFGWRPWRSRRPPEA